MSMKRKNGFAAISLAVLFFAVGAWAQRAEVLSLNLVQDPAADALAETYLTVRQPSDVVRVSWLEMRGAVPVPQPSVARVYYARTPGGGDLSKYDTITVELSSGLKPLPGAGLVNMRNIRFRPNANNMGAGEYTCIVAYERNDTTYYSNYFSVMVAADQAPTLIDPKGLLGAKVINELTPTFSWNAVEGVPYYHILLSDEPFPVEDIIESGNLSGLDLSIVWQAITPNNRITYGTPDPSNTITAAPPPLSPGKDYMWLVLNNYGNHMAFTDASAFDLPGMFRVAGTPLREPRALTPADTVIDGNAPQNADITFRWTDLDTSANSYLVNLFVSTSPASLGVSDVDELGDVRASMLVWETTVSMPRNIDGRPARPTDTLTATLPNPIGTLTGKEYFWRVYARDERGAATTGKNSRALFEFKGLPTGSLTIRTVEVVGGQNGQETSVGLVELRTEVITGPMQAPLGFYTDQNGVAARTAANNNPFPAGTYRVTAIKEGYNNETVTVTVPDGGAADVKIFMKRPDAVIFGRVADTADGSWINLASVTAVSEWGDTVSTLTNAQGNFTLSCREADWTITIERTGYRTPRPRVVSLRFGDNHSFGTAYMTRHTERLSGVVRNTAGTPILGARVRVLRDGILVDQLASTSETGAYSFLLPPGTYTLTVEMPGFSMFSRVINFTGSASQDAVLAPNAAMVNGSIIGRSWNPGRGAYDFAPITNARVIFSDASDTLTVTSDATFGNFTLSVPGGRTFTVRAEAAGFVSDDLKPVTTVGGETGVYIDTLQALARIGGITMLRDDAGSETPVGNVDVIIYDNAARRTVATARSSHNGNFEIRNIPNGNFVINAGMAGHYQFEDSPELVVTDGRPRVNGDLVNPSAVKILVAEGKKTITWNVTGYTGAGVVKVVSPLNRTISFTADSPPTLENAGPGSYVIEAVATGDTSLLQLSYRSFNVPADDNNAHSESISFPLSHTLPVGGVVTLGGTGRTVSLRVDAVSAAVPVPITGLALIYRNEGSARWDSVYVDNITSITGTGPATVTTRPNTVRDGSDLQYYFRVFTEDGDMYGSEKQIFTVYVEPSNKYITRLSVTPGVADPARDTLSLPSSYVATFELSAFYSDLFRLVPASENIGAITWSIASGSGAAITGPANGRTVRLRTGAGQGLFTLRAAVNPTNSGYTIREGRNIVEFPIRVTGAAVDTIIILRSGDVGPVSSSERVSFRAEGRDTANNPVTVSPVWGIRPETAGEIQNGVFTPRSNYFGGVRVFAYVSDSTINNEYYEPGAALPGISVIYMIRNRAADTADTRRGLRMAIPAGVLPAGQSAELRAVVRPEPKNNVHRGSGGFRMADSLSYDIDIAGINRLSADAEFSIFIDIPPHLRSEASKNPDGFKIARWYPDSLAWVALPSSEMVGNAVTARISRSADDLAVNAAPLQKSAQPPARSGRKTRKSKSVATTAAVTAPQASQASQMHASARYALIIQTTSLSVELTVSPNPFSPNIRPVKEYVRGRTLPESEVPYGTGIRISVGAPETFVSNMKVHIFNANGQRVWAVDKLNAPVGENIIWWDGRTTSREEMWTPDFLERNKSRGRMARNGRYFVVVIVRDISGRERRVMKPVVLMK